MELPKREETTKVEVDKGVVAVMRTLTARELASIWERSAPQITQIKAEDGKEAQAEMGNIALRASLEQMVTAFETHVLGFEGEDAPLFEGKPFIAGNEDHLARLRPTWKVTGGSQLINAALMTGYARGN